VEEVVEGRMDPYHATKYYLQNLENRVMTSVDVEGDRYLAWQLDLFDWSRSFDEEEEWPHNSLNHRMLPPYVVAMIWMKENC
jgi:hypothetical protein